jgi:hypothetical protein
MRRCLLCVLSLRSGWSDLVVSASGVFCKTLIRVFFEFLVILEHVTYLVFIVLWLELQVISEGGSHS